MTQTIAVELGIILLLVLANGLFAMSEIAVVTSRKARLHQMARRGSRGAGLALALAENPDRFLSTIQIGITLIGVFAGAFGGATLARQIDDYLETFPALYSYSEAIGVGVVVLLITYLSLILGELVPKRLALNAPERVASILAPFMQVLSRIVAPAVHFLGASTRLVLWVLRVAPRKASPITPQELRLMIFEGVSAGTIGHEERAILDRGLRLASRPVRTLMTPRVEVLWLDATLSLDELRRLASQSAHHRFPYATERIDEIRGVVTLKDLWRADVDSIAALERYVRQPLFVPETATALSVLQSFRETRNHLAVVLDEFGGVEGIVTTTDILEALVGELPDVGEAFEPLVLRRADGSWSVDASIDLQELEALTGIPVLPQQKEEFQTIAGYVISRSGGLPRIGDIVLAGDYRFEIVDMDGRRVDRIHISRVEGR